MAPTRTSSRQAAVKAKESIANGSATKNKSSAGAKRKGAKDKGPPAKRDKKDQHTAKSDGGEIRREQEKVKTGEIEKKPAKKTPEPADGREAGVRKSQEREDIVPSNILEKGIIYFFFRPRVSVEDPHSMGDVARSFFVLRPTPLEATLDGGQGPVVADSRCRLMMLPKKKFPSSVRERDMGFVEKTGQSTKELEKFLAGGKYETSTHGERIIQEARPYAEGVYAITSAPRHTHLVYILTIPDKLGDVQENFGLRTRGSWIVQSKNPKYPGPSFSKLPHEPGYPEHVREKFRDLRWAPLQPEFIDYPNAQFLMIGQAEDSLGQAATVDPGAKQPHEEQPGEELEKLEHENEERVEALSGDATVYQDLGLYAENYAKVLSTWN